MAEVRLYQAADIAGMTAIWNDITDEGVSFPGDEILTEQQAADLFAAQSATGCAVQDGEVAGLYILHPNNAGRCAHIANASYGVERKFRGKGVGEALVRHSIETAREMGFLGLQFNAVVETNRAAIHLYEKLGFTRVGRIGNGYHLKDGRYADLLIFFLELQTPEELEAGQ